MSQELDSNNPLTVPSMGVQHPNLDSHNALEYHRKKKHKYQCPHYCYVHSMKMI